MKVSLSMRTVCLEYCGTVAVAASGASGASAGKTAGLCLDLPLVLAGTAHKRSASSAGGDSQVGLTLLLGAGSEEPDSLVGLTLFLCLFSLISGGESRSVLLDVPSRAISMTLALVTMVLKRFLVSG